MHTENPKMDEILLSKIFFTKNNVQPCKKIIITQCFFFVYNHY